MYGYICTIQYAAVISFVQCQKGIFGKDRQRLVNLFNENDNGYEVTWLLAFLESHSLLSQMNSGMTDEASGENPNTMKDSRSSSLSYLLRGDGAVILKNKKSLLRRQPHGS